MVTIDTSILDKVIRSVRSLPKVSQDFIAHEVTQKIADLNTPILTSTQRKIVKDRMSRKRKHVSAKQVQDVMHRYNPNI